MQGSSQQMEESKLPVSIDGLGIDSASSPHEVQHSKTMNHGGDSVSEEANESSTPQADDSVAETEQSAVTVMVKNESNGADKEDSAPDPTVLRKTTLPVLASTASDQSTQLELPLDAIVANSPSLPNVHGTVSSRPLGKPSRSRTPRARSRKRIRGLSSKSSTPPPPPGMTTSQPPSHVLQKGEKAMPLKENGEEKAGMGLPGHSDNLSSMGEPTGNELSPTWN